MTSQGKDLVDLYQRPLRDLRISVTDRCNFRCGYCMPAEVFGPSYQFLPKHEILSFEEIVKITQTFIKFGVDKIRLTGGEPLLRRGVDDLVAQLSALAPECDLAMTTNGVLLKNYSEKLVNAGLKRITVSLDSLDEKTFGEMNGVGAPPKKVIEGIDAALASGLKMKINTVVKKGVNDQHTIALAGFARERGVTLRFIEYMDTGNTNQWQLGEVQPSKTLFQDLSELYPLNKVATAKLGETAQRYTYADMPELEVGFISSVTKPFCHSCNRARLSADGQVFTCLFAEKGHDIKAVLRSESGEAMLEKVIEGIWAIRDDRYSELRSSFQTKPVRPEMSYIGG